MSAQLPKALQKLIEELAGLPGVGPRTAERYAYSILNNSSVKAGRLAAAIQTLHAGVGRCPITYALIDSTEKVSPLYSDPTRNKQQVIVVENPFDVLSIEKTGQYHGTYHVLNGLLSPIDGIDASQLTISQLVDRVRSDNIEEVILATSASVEGESTALYIQHALADSGATLSRLARGLPVGVDLEYADQITLARALEGRQNL